MGSEMCIRDSSSATEIDLECSARVRPLNGSKHRKRSSSGGGERCTARDEFSKQVFSEARRAHTTKMTPSGRPRRGYFHRHIARRLHPLYAFRAKNRRGSYSKGVALSGVCLGNYSSSYVSAFLLVLSAVCSKRALVLLHTGFA